KIILQSHLIMQRSREKRPLGLAPSLPVLKRFGVYHREDHRAPCYNPSWRRSSDPRQVTSSPVSHSVPPIGGKPGQGRVGHPTRFSSRTVRVRLSASSPC